MSILLLVSFFWVEFDSGMKRLLVIDEIEDICFLSCILVFFVKLERLIIFGLLVNIKSSKNKV